MLLGSLAIQYCQRAAAVLISVIAFSVCFVTLLSAGILAMRGTGEMAPIKYIVLLAYAGFYGLFGLAFSFLTGKPISNEPRKDA